MDYNELISLENLFNCWYEFKKGKRSKPDVTAFELNLEDNIFQLQRELRSQIYRHSPYFTFHIHDPKFRVISKATVKDRIVHHLVFKELYRLFESSFIYHSYSSRLDKGTHLAIKNLAKVLRQESKNCRRTCFALKCDIRQFFFSIPHQKLFSIIKSKAKDEKFLWLIQEIISSFEFAKKGGALRERGVPIGNVTSQIFANIYLNELDQFIKHQLKVRRYFRYTDDFVIVHQKPEYLQAILREIAVFLENNLDLRLHPRKIEIRKFRQGIDFLGYVVLPRHIVLRTKTKRRMMKKLFDKKQRLSPGKFNQSLQSYLGLLKHCQGHKLFRKLNSLFSQ